MVGLRSLVDNLVPVAGTEWHSLIEASKWIENEKQILKYVSMYVIILKSSQSYQLIYNKYMKAFPIYLP